VAKKKTKTKRARKVVEAVEAPVPDVNPFGPPDVTEIPRASRVRTLHNSQEVAAEEFEQAFANIPMPPPDSLADHTATMSSANAVPLVFHPLGTCEFQDRICKFCNAREAVG
jgi:hypothetical protein